MVTSNRWQRLLGLFDPREPKLPTATVQSCMKARLTAGMLARSMQTDEDTVIKAAHRTCINLDNPIDFDQYLVIAHNASGRSMFLIPVSRPSVVALALASWGDHDWPPTTQRIAELGGPDSWLLKSQGRDEESASPA